MFEVSFRAGLGDGETLATRSTRAAAERWIREHLHEYPHLSATDFVISENY